jgi:hypothetical protein
MTPDRTRAERALAFLVAQIRDGWDEPGTLVALRKVSDRPLADVTAAALHCAVHRLDQRSPACIALDGEHWRALERMTGAPSAAEPWPKCDRHGQWEPCLRCHSEAITPATPDRIRQIRTAREDQP